jgi:PadR family transcriptional regulator, regulatory protein PadR
MSSEPRITLPLLKVLDAMLAEPTRDHWGFELIKSTGLQSGTLYPLLARLETAGWLESGWETEQKRGRPRRRYYRLTGVGAEAARRTFTELPQPAPRTPRPAFVQPLDQPHERLPLGRHWVGCDDGG